MEELLNRVLQRHKWEGTEEGASRRCKCCGQEELYIPGDDIDGYSWRITSPGRAGAHSSGWLSLSTFFASISARRSNR